MRPRASRKTTGAAQHLQTGNKSARARNSASGGKVKLAVITSVTTVVVALLAVLPKLFAKSGEPAVAPVVTGTAPSAPTFSVSGAVSNSAINTGSGNLAKDGGIVVDGNATIHLGDSTEDRDRDQAQKDQAIAQGALEDTAEPARRAGITDQLDKLKASFADAKNLCDREDFKIAQVAFKSVAARAASLKKIAGLKMELDAERFRAQENQAPAKTPDLWEEALRLEPEGAPSLDPQEIDAECSKWEKCRSEFAVAARAASLIDTSNEAELLIGVELTIEQKNQLNVTLQKRAARNVAEHRMNLILLRRDPTMTPDQLLEVARTAENLPEASASLRAAAGTEEVWFWRFKLARTSLPQ
jgi:hypothetical protein